MTATKSSAKVKKKPTLLEATSVREVLDQFRVGFELETQATAGHSYRSAEQAAARANESREVNKERLDAYAKDKTNKFMASAQSVVSCFASGRVRRATCRAMLDAYLKTLSKTKREAAASSLSGNIDQFLPDLPAEDMVKYIKGKIPKISMDWLCANGYVDEDLRALHWDYHYEDIWSKNQTAAQFLQGGNHSGRTFLTSKFKGWDDSILQLGSDGTVRGVEVRTVGGLTVKEFIRAAECVFNGGVDHEIDTGCSFHVHVSVVKQPFSYSTKFQWALYEWLMNHIKEVPASVRRRWMKAAITTVDGELGGGYYKLALSKEKYSFVHYHSGFKTWEFRCFGNVKSKKDAIKCMQLALRATMHAIRVTKGKADLVFSDKDVSAGKVSSKINECLTDGTPLLELAPEDRSSKLRLQRRKLKERYESLKASGATPEELSHVKSTLDAMVGGTKKPKKKKPKAS